MPRTINAPWCVTKISSQLQWLQLRTLTDRVNVRITSLKKIRRFFSWHMGPHLSATKAANLWLCSGFTIRGISASYYLLLFQFAVVSSPSKCKRLYLYSLMRFIQPYRWLIAWNEWPMTCTRTSLNLNYEVAFDFSMDKVTKLLTFHWFNRVMPTFTHLTLAAISPNCNYFSFKEVPCSLHIVSLLYASIQIRERAGIIYCVWSLNCQYTVRVDIDRSLWTYFYET